MRAVRYHEPGDSAVFRTGELDWLEPGRGELLVETRIAGVTPVDTKYPAGVYEPGTLPMIPGADFAGVVSAVGSGADAYEPGNASSGPGSEETAREPARSTCLRRIGSWRLSPRTSTSTSRRRSSSSE